MQSWGLAWDWVVFTTTVGQHTKAIAIAIEISYKAMENLSKTLNIYRLSALNILKGYVKWHHMFRKGKICALDIKRKINNNGVNLEQTKRRVTTWHLNLACLDICEGGIFHLCALFIHDEQILAVNHDADHL